MSECKTINCPTCNLTVSETFIEQKCPRCQTLIESKFLCGSCHSCADTYLNDSTKVEKDFINKIGQWIHKTRINT